MYQFIQRQTKYLYISKRYSNNVCVCVCFISSVRGPVLRWLERGKGALISKQEGEVRHQACNVTVSRGFFIDRVTNRVPFI